MLSGVRKYLDRFVHYYYSNRNLRYLNTQGLVYFSVNNPLAPFVFNLVKKIKLLTEFTLDDLDDFYVYSAIKQTEKIDGDIAEVGVFRGRLAILISETSSKPIHLFDTFEGLPDIGKNDNHEQFHKGDYSSNFDQIKDLFKNYPNTYLYKGFFPLTASPILNKAFSFVHLDVDIY